MPTMLMSKIILFLIHCQKEMNLIEIGRLCIAYEGRVYDGRLMDAVSLYDGRYCFMKDGIINDVTLTANTRRATDS